MRQPAVRPAKQTRHPRGEGIARIARPALGGEPSRLEDHRLIGEEPGLARTRDDLDACGLIGDASLRTSGLRIAAHAEMNFSRTAYSASSTRSWMSSFSITLVTCLSTVFTEMPSISAICFFA